MALPAICALVSERNLGERLGIARAERHDREPIYRPQTRTHLLASLLPPLSSTNEPMVQVDLSGTVVPDMHIRSIT